MELSVQDKQVGNGFIRTYLINKDIKWKFNKIESS